MRQAHTIIVNCQLSIVNCLSGVSTINNHLCTRTYKGYVMKYKQTLWTKNFTCITLATFLSAIGGEVMTLPLSLLVFEQTQSTILSSIIFICGVLPDVLLSVLIAPFIDKGNKKRWIIGLDILMALVYVVMGFYIANHEFQYIMFVLLSLGLGTISVFYRLAYNAWYPNLIPVGLEQKGYAISGTLYPLVIIVMSPVATFLYEKTSMRNLFFLVAGITLLSVLVESLIRESTNQPKLNSSGYNFSQYKQDIKEGFAYLKREKGIRNIYTYMAITGGVSEGTTIAIQAYYQTNPLLSVTMLGFLKSAEMVGRVLSGFVQYRINIPAKKRYGITKLVYIVYEFSDMILLFLPYPVMLINRFICGGLGTASATIRETAVQSYLPNHIRARVNALFNSIFSIGGVFFQVLGGALGEVLPYRAVVLVLGTVSLAAIWIFIVIPGKENRKVYETVKES